MHVLSLYSYKFFRVSYIALRCFDYYICIHVNMKLYLLCYFKHRTDTSVSILRLSVLYNIMHSVLLHLYSNIVVY